MTKSASCRAASRSVVLSKLRSALNSLASLDASLWIISRRSESMSMKETRLPDRPSVRHRSFTRPSENVALPAPIREIFTGVLMVSSLSLN